MVLQTRSKLREAASEPFQSSGSMQTRQRLRASGAGEPEIEREPQEEVEKHQLPRQSSPLGGGSLLGGARRYLSQRTRNLKRAKDVPQPVRARTLFDRFPFLHSVLAQLHETVQKLQLHQFSSKKTNLGIAAFLGFLHWIHLMTLYENDLHFSHLSSLEREMTFRTEMGLYYSYFKTIIEAPSFLEGLWMIMNDRLTEYSLVINTIKRFHLYPEVIIASCYRILMGIMNLFGLETKTCWNVTRVEPLTEVESCEGMCLPTMLLYSH